MIHIEQIKPELTWRLRRDALYPQKHTNEMAMNEDTQGYHFGAFIENKLVGVVSLFAKDKIWQFRKLAVDAGFRGQGVGTQLLQYITGFALSEDAQCLWCNARTEATGFYLQFGFLPTGEAFTNNNIDYEIVEKRLP